MNILPGNLLHIYNRGNNKQPIFFSEDDYCLFTKKIRIQLSGVSDVLAYCLMPNHYHLLIHGNEMSCEPKKIGQLVSTTLKNNIRVLQSSYTNAINKRTGNSGSLFQQNAKCKLLNKENGTFPLETYADVCFHYIHQNPVKAGLAGRLEDWKYSSFNEYLSGIDGVCNKLKAYELFNISEADFYQASYAVLKEEMVKKLF